jgi:hypothetical protein
VRGAGPHVTPSLVCVIVGGSAIAMGGVVGLCDSVVAAWYVAYLRARLCVRPGLCVRQCLCLSVGQSVNVSLCFLSVPVCPFVLVWLICGMPDYA